jgi:hypothetical protein
VLVDESAMEALRALDPSEPVVLLPTHKSYFDFLLVSWVIPSPPPPPLIREETHHPLLSERRHTTPSYQRGAPPPPLIREETHDPPVCFATGFVTGVIERALPLPPPPPAPAA